MQLQVMEAAMKRNAQVALLVALNATSEISFAARDHAVRGHVKKDGTYVSPTRSTNPNSTRTDNYSSKPNVNPYSGREGRIDPYAPKPPTTPRR